MTIHTPGSFLWCFYGSQVTPPLNTFLPIGPLAPLEDWELPEQGATSVFPDTGVYTGLLVTLSSLIIFPKLQTYIPNYL